MKGLLERGYMPPVWLTGIARAPRYFHLSRWVLRLPRWWNTRGLWIEPPFAASYVKNQLLDVESPAWSAVFSEWCSHLLACWVSAIVEERLFVRLSLTILDWFARLPTDRFRDGPGGKAMLDTYTKMVQAHAVFPWTTVVVDVI